MTPIDAGLAFGMHPGVVALFYREGKGGGVENESGGENQTAISSFKSSPRSVIR